MNHSGSPLTLAIVAFGLLPACLSEEAPSGPSRDAGEPTFSLQVLDYAGRPIAASRAPLRSRFVLDSAQPLDLQDDPVRLFTGTADEDLLEDLQRAPLRAEHLALQVTSDVRYDERARVVLAPREPLHAGEPYVLAVAGYARFRGKTRVSASGAPFVFDVTAAASADGGARVIRSFPAAGSSAVATNLCFAAIVFEGTVFGLERGVWMEDEHGQAIDAEVSEFPCAELDASGETCAQIVPRGELSASAQYTLRIGDALHDAHDAPLPSWNATFVTGTERDTRAPQWQPPACALDERTLSVGCALLDDTHVTLRLQVDEPARFAITDADGNRQAELAPRGNVTWSRAELAAGAHVALEISATDLAGRRVDAHVDLVTERELPTLSISETRADPLGREPTQELVELWNFGDAPVSIAGFSLSDSADDPGLTIADGAAISPGARVLLVADAFDPDDARDVPPAPGTRLVRVGKSLTRGGLANAGEPLFLRDAEGRRVSAAPATPLPKPGVCLVRTSSDLRSGAAGSFGYDADDSCTPGR